MNGYDWMQIALYMGVFLLAAAPLGIYMARIYEGKTGLMGKLLGPVERLIYRLLGVSAEQEMNWKQYAVAMLLFKLAGFMVVYLLQRIQGSLPLNPQGLTAVSPDSSFNTAASFITNTNWQGYGGESTMSYLTQMVALTVQNFLSAAAGMATLVALIRGLARRETTLLGSFWVDLTRSTLYILMPLSFVFALILVSQGVPQTLAAYETVPLMQATSYDEPQKDDKGNPIMEPVKDDKGNAVMEEVKDDKGVTVLDDKKQPKMQQKMQQKTKSIEVKDQTIALGPVASQEAIKQLGTNGGGFFNVNSAHPYENPTPLTNLLEMLAILVIPAALCITFGELVGDRRQGWALLVAMTIIFSAGLTTCIWAEKQSNPAIAALNVSGGNMEGKEQRFGIVNSAIWATATTATSNGSVNSMHDSFLPLGGMVPILMIQIGEVIYGGVGSGLYGMLIFVIVTVFIAGLMVGRTPEYLGKKIEAFEMKMGSLILLIPPVLLLVGTAIGVVTADGKAGMSNPGAHGFSEVLYAFSSASNNNGSAFAGLNANTFFYNLALGVCILIGRFWLAVPALAIAGSLARKKKVPIGAGTLATHTPLFVGFLVAVIVIFAALLHFPALALGPIVEHLQMTH